MPDNPHEGLIIDSDWKQEAQREKQRLSEAEQAREAQQPQGAVRFADLLNVLVMQVAAALGGMVGPGGQMLPPDLPAARYFIDLLGMLEEKTKGNLTADEKKMLEQVLYELRMEFVRITGVRPGTPSGDAPQEAAGAP